MERERTDEEEWNKFIHIPLEDLFDYPEQANECVIPECKEPVRCRMLLLDNKNDDMILRNFCEGHARNFDKWQQIWFTANTPEGWDLETGAEKEGKSE